MAAHALPVRLRAPLQLAGLWGAMARDKKARAGGLRFVVLPAIGRAATQAGLAAAAVEASFRDVGAV